MKLELSLGVAGTGEGFQYRVVGMPPAEEALIANRGNADKVKWQIFRSGKTKKDCYGEFSTKEDALEALRLECEKECL